jgi:penicillin-binding protein 1C
VQLAGLYAALADDGLPRPLVFSTASASANKPPLLSPQARFLVLDMMRGGAGDRSIAWKTGTSHGFRDAWSVGVRGDYVLVVWLGNFSGRGNNALVARKCAAPLMFDLFVRLRLPEKSIVPPDGVRQVELCAASGELPGLACGQVMSGWFIPGVSPVSQCQLHREILIDGATGNRVARDDGRPGLKREVHEFWAPDLLELFRKAGLPRRPPPNPENGTDTLAGMDHGEAPEIISPLPGRIYQAGGSQIPLKARATSGVGKLYWFCGDAFLGSGGPQDSPVWEPAPGKHMLRVLDDHGRSAQAEVRVGVE